MPIYDLDAIARDYKAAACLTSSDGREWWRDEGKRQIYLFMQSAAHAIAELRAEMQPEGPPALQQALRRVDELERQLVAAREEL